MPKNRRAISIPFIILRFAFAAGVLALFMFGFMRGGRLPLARAATNVSSTPAGHYAWNDVLTWIDFYNTNTVNLSSTGLTGYASSSVGDISLDCATTRSGNICGSSNYQVLNDGSGGLSGWGWNDAYGWISFCGGLGTAACPGAVSYQVKVDPISGIFTDSGVHRNYAWNDVIGWISFNCDNTGDCATSNYAVAADWSAGVASGTLDSSIFDTGVSGGAAINAVTWFGALPSPANNASVGFQFAVATSTAGPWNYIGSDGTSASWYTGAPGVTQPVQYALHNNKRYFRYRIRLTSNLAQTASPRVDDISVNWSR